MSGRREVVTLQFGNSSSFLGAHYWNIEEAERQRQQQEGTPETDPSVLFRHTESRTGSVHTPRLLVVGCTGSLGPVPAMGTLAASESVFHEEERPSLPGTWDGKVKLLEQPRVAPSPFDGPSHAHRGAAAEFGAMPTSFGGEPPAPTCPLHL